MIRIVYIFAFLFCQLLANNKIESSVSFEYWINEDLRLFVFQYVIDNEIEDEIKSWGNPPDCAGWFLPNLMVYKRG